MRTRYYTKGQLPELDKLVKLLELDKYFAGEVELIGCDPIVKSPHLLGEAISYALLVQSMAASALWHERTGNISNVSTNITDAVHCLHAAHYVKQQGYDMSIHKGKAPQVATFGNYKCKDGTYLLIASGPPYAKLENGYLNFFNCGNTREAIGAKIAEWDSYQLQEALNNIGLPATIAMTRDEWSNKHPQGQAISKTPVIEIIKIAEGEPCAFSADNISPLCNINMLDFTHVLAGPRCGMAFAELGANVLRIDPPFMLDPLAMHLGLDIGKKCAFLDLNQSSDLKQMHKLMATADVINTSYRPSVLEKFEITPQKFVTLNQKGGVFISINAYGHTGPWKDRAGFDHNAQIATGFSMMEGGNKEPKFSPVSYLNDYLTGYFATTGAIMALIYRAKFGGSYHVKVSLAKSAMWVQELGYINPQEYGNCPDDDGVYPVKYIHFQEIYGTITHVANAVTLSNWPKVRLHRLEPFGASPAKW